MSSPYRKFKLRKVPKILICHQCGKEFKVKCITPDASCPRCGKAHKVSTGKPYPYRKVMYWQGDELVPVSKSLMYYFREDPLEFGYEIVIARIPLKIVPYITEYEKKLFLEGMEIGRKELKNKEK